MQHNVALAVQNNRENFSFWMSHCERRLTARLEGGELSCDSLVVVAVQLLHPVKGEIGRNRAYERANHLETPKMRSLHLWRFLAGSCFDCSSRLCRFAPDLFDESG